MLLNNFQNIEFMRFQYVSRTLGMLDLMMGGGGTPL